MPRLKKPKKIFRSGLLRRFLNHGYIRQTGGDLIIDRNHPKQKPFDSLEHGERIYPSIRYIEQIIKRPDNTQPAHPQNQYFPLHLIDEYTKSKLEGILNVKDILVDKVEEGYSCFYIVEEIQGPGTTSTFRGSRPLNLKNKTTKVLRLIHSTAHPRPR